MSPDMKKITQNAAFFGPRSSIFFATFSRYEKRQRLPTNGMVEPVLSFFLPKVRRILLLDAPHLISDTISPIVEVYERGRVSKRFRISKFFYLPIYLWCKIPSNKETRISFKVRDFFSVFFVALWQKGHYDLFIGLESVYTLAGLILKKFGIVKRVIYYVSDYSPRRFENTLFNALYIYLDRFCLLHADFTWDVSPAIQKGRYEAGLSPTGTHRVIHVPNGLFPSQIKSLPVKKRKRNDLVYMGILEPDMGPDLAIRSLAAVKKHFPNVRLHIIGGPERHIKIMKELVRTLHLEQSVLFHGFIPSFEKMAQKVRESYIGLAPYRSFSDSKRWYGDAGKIRQYIAAGLPVVTTHVPPLGTYVVERGAGIRTKDTVNSFSRGILKLLADDTLYAELAKAAHRLSHDNTWENVYQKAFREMSYDA